MGCPKEVVKTSCLSPGPLCGMCVLCTVQGYLVGRGEGGGEEGVLKPSLSSLLRIMSRCGAPEGRGIFLICSKAPPRLEVTLLFPGGFLVGWECSVPGATQNEVQGAEGSRLEPGYKAGTEGPSGQDWPRLWG